MLGAGFFLLLELVLRIKLGSIWLLILAGVPVQLWIAARTGDRDPQDSGYYRLMLSIYYSISMTFAVFACFAILNGLVRSIWPLAKFFQLP